MLKTKELPTWLQLISKVCLSFLLLLGLISVNPFSVYADTVYIPTAASADSRLRNVGFGTDFTKLYGNNQGNSSLGKNTECYFYLTFAEPFVMTNAQFAVVINNSRTTTIHVYGSDSSFSNNVELGSASRSNTGTITVTNTNQSTTAYQYYVVGMNSNYLNASNASIWSVDGSAISNGRSFLFNGIAPVVQPTTYNISASVTPNGSGTVTGAGTYDENDSVSLLASPAQGYQFDYWTNDYVANYQYTSNPMVFLATRNCSWVAHFSAVTAPPADTYTISTSVSPSGGGSVTGGGTYEDGTVISLTATANSGYTFTQWSDGNTSNPRTVTVSANATYTAIFTANTPQPTTVTIDVTVNNPSYGDAAPVRMQGQVGVDATIQAFPNTGYIFQKWIKVGTGETISTSNPYTFTYSESATYQAVFIIDPNYIAPSVLMLVHKNIYNYNYPTDPVLITLFSYPGAEVVNNYGQTVQKTFTAGVDYPAYVDYAVSYNYSVTLYSFKGIRDSNNTHFGNNVTVQSGIDKDIVRVNAQVFYSSANTDDGIYNVVTVYYPLPDVSSVSTVNNAYLAGTYTAGSITYYPDNVGSSTDQILVSGDQGSIDSSNSLNTSTNTMNTNFNSYFDMEDDFLTDMNDAMNDIDPTSDLMVDSSFLSAASWVRDQFDALTLANPFGLVVTFTLILGLALLIVGKIR